MAFQLNLYRHIPFLNEKIRSLCHSLPFEQVPGIMVVCMVLHIVKFVNGFPQRGGGVKHYSPGEIMTGRRLHANDLQLAFGIYCQVAENVEPSNSLAPRTRAAILLGNSGSLSGNQLFLALDGGQTIVRHQWVVLPELPDVIDCVNVLGINEPSILTFTNWHGQDIGDLAQDFEPCVDEDDDSLLHTQMTNFQELTCIQVMLNSQEWTRILMLSPQEWKWALKPMEMFPKSRGRYMASDNKISSWLQLKCQAPNQTLSPVLPLKDPAAQQREDQPGWSRSRPPTH